MHTFRRCFYPYISPFDPCPPMRVKTFVTPPNLFIPFQPPNLPQFAPKVALCKGTLWPIFFDPYFNTREKMNMKREEKP